MKRIALVANKAWEVEPIISALLNSRFSTEQKVQSPSYIKYPWTLPQGAAMPRIVWNNFQELQIELWCVQDIMEISNPSDSELYSSSEIKNHNLYKVINFNSTRPDLLIALGTAGFGDETQNNNGCVVIGSDVFIHNFHPNGENPKSHWDDARQGQLITSSIEDDFFSIVDTASVSYIESRLLRPFLNSSQDVQIISGKEYLSLGVVNITNYKDYAASDQKGIDALRASGYTGKIGSVETTHGIIRLSCDTRFAYISGITDRVNHFNDDVNGRDLKGNIKTEAQNFTAAFNIGVFLASALARIAAWLNTK